jgi:hypothetical protein
VELPNREVARVEATGLFAPRRGSQNGWGVSRRFAALYVCSIHWNWNCGAGQAFCAHSRQNRAKGHTMKTMISAALLVLALPIAAQAQGIIGGAQRGAEEGAAAAGPVGGVVGGVLGGVTGGVAGLLGVEERPRFRQYVVRQAPPSYQYQDEVRVGAVLPTTGVQYYEVPAEYGVREHRYTVVNNRVVLVEPRTRRIVEIVE